MRNKIIFYPPYGILLIIFFLHGIIGCESLREITIEKNKQVKIYKIETVDGKEINFQKSKLGYAVLSDSELVSYKWDGEEETFSAANVKKYYTGEFDFLKTAGLLVGIASFFVAVILIALGGSGFK